MRIRRSKLTSGFVQIPNVTVRDPRLSYMARGILAELLSRPDGWETTADELWRQATEARKVDGESRRAFRAAFAELKKYGYIVASREQLPSGRIGTVLTARDYPNTATDVPHAGMSVPPGQTGKTAGHADVPACGTSVPPGQTDVSAGRTDVPHAGTSIRRRGEEDGGEKKDAVADAVGKSAGGFAPAGAREAAAGQTQNADCGSAASTKTTTPTKKQSPRPQTIKTRPRQLPAGYDTVRAAIPADVASPDTRLYPGLIRAVCDLLTGNAEADIPRRTPEQVIARINRRWHKERTDQAEPVRSPQAWLAAAILTQDCPDQSCEDGTILGAGRPCPACRERRAEERAATQAAAQLAARLAEQNAAADQAATAQQAYEQEAAREEHRVRQQLAATGMHGRFLNHQIEQHMARWRNQHPQHARADPEPPDHRERHHHTA